jgi:hypothetical protein
MSREDALERLSVLVQLIDPSPEHTLLFTPDQIAELQKILTDHNYTVRELMREVGPVLSFVRLHRANRRLQESA